MYRTDRVAHVSVGLRVAMKQGDSLGDNCLGRSTASALQMRHYHSICVPVASPWTLVGADAQ